MSELGPLPEPDKTMKKWPAGAPWFSAAQMQAERERCYALGVAAGIEQERSRCRYPQCLENEDERCPRWLTGECEGPPTLR